MFAITASLLLSCALLWAGKEPAGKIVDAGTFDILVNGQRIGSETFSIEQRATMSVAKAELKVAGDTDKASQSAVLQLTPRGELHHYLWRELAPGTAQNVLEVTDTVVIQRVTTGASTKPIEFPYMLPPSTMVLDDYFFSHREILIWRYMASGCAPKNGKLECKLAPTKFGVFVPRQQSSAVVTLEYAGREKVTSNGAERELSRFKLTTDDNTEWSLWVDDSYKLIRILIPALKIEVVRN